MKQTKWSKEDHIGKRAIFTDRNGKTKEGTITDVIEISSQSGYMLNFIPDGSHKERNYIPADMIALKSPEA